MCGLIFSLVGKKYEVLLSKECTYVDKVATTAVHHVLSIPFIEEHKSKSRKPHVWLKVRAECVILDG